MKKNGGITLLALIITIIIMLILAGVTISILGGSDGIVAKAEKAVSETEIASVKEQTELMMAEIGSDYYEAKYINKESAATTKDMGTYIESRVGTEGIAIAKGTYTLKVNSGNIALLSKAGTTILTGTLSETGNATWDEVVNDSGNTGGGNADSGTTEPGGNTGGETQEPEIATSVVLADDYGHSYTVTETGSYYFYSYTYGQNFMSVFNVTSGTHGLQAEKLGEYSLETGRKRADESLDFPNTSFFDGKICLSSEDELVDTYNPNYTEGTVLVDTGWATSPYPSYAVCYRLAPGFYYHVSEGYGCADEAVIEGFTTYVVYPDFTISKYQEFTPELPENINMSKCNYELVLEQWVNLDELCVTYAFY